MKTSELHYDLPPERIAQHPVTPRDASRLMVVNRKSGKFSHTVFSEIPGYLNSSDCLIVNNTRVIPAKFEARRSSGAVISGLFLRQLEIGRWEILGGNTKRVRDGEWLSLGASGRRMIIETRGERGKCEVRIDPAEEAAVVLEEIGETPLPPYIEREQTATNEFDEEDRTRYQTVFARTPGAVAAPTAGLHFTPELLREVENKGVGRAEVTLHVGIGTFAPVTVDDLADHQMHSEWYEISPTTADKITETRGKGGRIVAVGTTSVRVLESVAKSGGAETGWTNLLIYPPYQFKTTDSLITNFHLPGSTLLALVSAFAGTELIKAAYQEAIEKEYRFFSYGDAMLII